MKPTWSETERVQVHDVPCDETDRLAALEQLKILYTPPEPELDELVTLAAAICGTPKSLFSLLDGSRQWCKATFGMESMNCPRELSICHHTIQQSGLLLVEDVTRDPRFNSNSTLIEEHGLRFYAGFPVSSSGGERVGALCVVDTVPRNLSTEQKSALQVLASQVSARLELRLKRMQLERALQQAEITHARLIASEQRFQTFMDCAPMLVYLKDAEGRMLYYNRTFAEHFKVSRDALLQMKDADLWSSELAAHYRQHDVDVLETRGLRIIQEQAINPDGSESLWQSYKFPCPDVDGRTLVGGFSVEVTADLRREQDLAHYREELEEANRKLRDLASLDGLTGLANRRTFDERSRSAYLRARRTDEPLSVILIDVDHFKRHNDQFGHGHGDHVLRLLAICLEKALGEGDLLARYGGEEFAAVLPETGEAASLLIAERLLDAVRAFPWPFAPVTISLGISSLNPATPDVTHLISLADEALYSAKNTGRNRAVSYRSIIERALGRTLAHPASETAAHV